MAAVTRVAKALAAAIVLLVAGYAAAGLVGGAIPLNAGWRAPAQGVTIYVESNGVHTGLILPKVAAGVDWRPLVPARDLADPRYAAFDHVAFGWGERAFFLETQTWADVKPRTILAAAVGSEATLIHVEHLPRPEPAADVRAIVLRPEEYRRLAAYIAASFAPHGAHHRGYAGYDTFYDARGHYDAIRTCNTWTGQALRTAGVRVGAWTPFPVTVMGWF
ncbi:TIGR02117 family protein [Sphingomonas sp.]|uniref:TIGR02117 family protein n=1 Tax=Sphingomonas sp. TaxID=28214 RepID=UPI0035BC264F